MTQHNHHHQDHQAHGEQPPHPRKSSDGDVHAGHDKHAGHSVASFRDKFWLTLLLTIPTLIWSGMVQHWFGYTAPQFPGRRTSRRCSARSCTSTADGSSSAADITS